MQEEVHKELWDRDEREIRQIQEGISINGQKVPDPKSHQRISFIKSAIRLGACAFGFFGMFEIGFIGLFLAEIVGIGEELV
jgi:hypothetical protein